MNVPGIFTKLLLCAIILNWHKVNAQSEITSSMVNISQQTATSPNSASLKKYFEIPVNMATGVPDIQIPIFDIKSGNINVPIRLSYHASGIKVDERSSWVGTGWSLSVGASIHRRVNGLDDLYASTQSQSNNPTSNYVTPDYISYGFAFSNVAQVVDTTFTASGANILDKTNRFFGRIANGQIDGEADEYIFSTPDESGTFYFNQKANSYVFNKPNGCQIYTNNGSYWTFTAKNGNIYQFDADEKVVNPGFLSGVASALNSYTAATWYPSSIQDVVNNKTVSFIYSWHDYMYRTGLSMNREYTPGSDGKYNVYRSNNVTATRSMGEEVSISKITFDEGTVIFEQDTATRKDAGTHFLKNIYVYNNNNLLVKQFKFSYAYVKGDTSSNGYKYFPSTLGYTPTFVDSLAIRPFLTSVQEINYDESGNAYEIPAYTFHYKNDTKLPCLYSFAQDYWGYYNGKVSNTSLYPTMSEPTGYGVPAQSNREVDTTYVQCGVLDRISYPTGGSVSFTYESNRTNTEGIIGGLRIKRIENYDSIGAAVLAKEYSYLEESGVESGSILFRPTFFYFYTSSTSVGFSQITSILKLEGNPVYPLFPNMGSPVLYSTVVEKQRNGANSILTRHYFTGYYDLQPHELNLSYRNATVGVPHNKITNLDNFTGLEYRTEYLKRQADGTYRSQKSEQTSYGTIYNSSNSVWNLEAAWSDINLSSFAVVPGNDPFSQTPMNMLPTVNGYRLFQETAVRNYTYSRYWDENNNLLEGKTFYTYDTTNGNVKTIKTTNSRGDSLFQFISYPNDFISGNATNATNVAIDALKNSNVLNVPIEIVEVIKYKSSGSTYVKGATYYEYDNLKLKRVYKINEDILYSSFVTAYNNASNFYKDTHYKLDKEILAFDQYKNILSTVIHQDTMSYIWDVKHELPVAAVKNASYNDIAFTSFETSQNGGWIVSSTDRDLSAAVTGIRSFNLTGNSITKTSLNATRKYKLSYWSKSGSFTISGSTAVRTGETIDSWTYYEHTVSGVSTVAITGNNLIDELRIYPTEAKMLSYVIEPLLGVTAINDDNKVSYFEYQGIGQLRLVRNDKKEILKVYQSRYWGEQSLGKHVYRNIAMSKTYTKSCGTNYHGTSVTYTINAGKDTSAFSQVLANAKAQADLLGNGQTYANNNGKCVTNVVYANLELINENTSTHTADIKISLFEDGALTVPYEATNFSVEVVDDVYNDLSGETTHNSYTYTINGSEKIVRYGAPTSENTSQNGVAVTLAHSYYLSQNTWYSSTGF